jgi:mannose-6-phosphate isomerase-like protein (cupin superfamily)
MSDGVEAKHFQVHVDDVKPAAVQEDDGWRRVDIRWVVGNEKAGSAAGSEQICFWRTVFPPGATHARHTHPNADEAFFIIRGRGAAGTGEEEHEVGPGTALYVPAGVVHWFRNVGNEELELVGCYAPGGSLEDAGYVFVGDVTDEYRQVV